MRIALFKDSRISFIQDLVKAEISFEERRPMPNSIMASATYVTVAQTAAVASAVAAVLVAWIKARASRKIILTLKDKQVIHLEGYSLEEVKDLLHMTEVATVIDTQPVNKFGDHPVQPSASNGAKAKL